jgi:hypothetical protein
MIRGADTRAADRRVWKYASTAESNIANTMMLRRMARPGACDGTGSHVPVSIIPHVASPFTGDTPVWCVECGRKVTNLERVHIG